MKVVLSVRSEVAYNLIVKLLQVEPTLPDVQIQSRNAITIQDMEDAIEFYGADVYIVDSQIAESASLIEMVKHRNLDLLVIENDVKAVLPVMKERYGIEVEQKEDIYYEQEEKERIVIQEKIIEKEVIRTAYQAIPSKVIVVGSLYRGAGSTLLSTNLARMVAKRGIDVAYIEHPLIKPYMFDYLQIHNEEKKPYVDVAKEIQKEGIARSNKDAFIQDGIKWHVIDSRKPTVPAFTYENLLALSHAVQSNVLVIDISDRWFDPEVQKFLYLADLILMCVEPDPIKYEWSLYTDGQYMQKERQVMEFLMKNDTLSHKFELVLTKYIKGIDIKMVKSIMHKKPIVTLPYVSYGDIQKSLYKNKLIYDFEQNEQLFESTLVPVIAKFLPRDFVALSKGPKGFLQRMKFNRNDE